MVLTEPSPLSQGPGMKSVLSCSFTFKFLRSISGFILFTVSACATFSAVVRIGVGSPCSSVRDLAMYCA